MLNRLRALRASLRSVARLEQSLNELRASSESVSSDVLALSGAVEGARARSDVSHAQLMEFLHQIQRDNWDAATSRHQYITALLSSMSRSLRKSQTVAERPPGADEWFWEHYEDAANEVMDFLSEEAIRLEGLDVGDIGCGDGIIDLGLAIRGQPRSLVGFDIQPTDVDAFRELAKNAGVADDLPDSLTFRTCGAAPAPGR